MSIPVAGLQSGPIVFKASQFERRILTGALGLLPLFVLAVESFDRRLFLEAGPRSSVAAGLCFAASLVFALLYRYELRIDPSSRTYDLRAGFPLFSHPLHGDLRDVERVRIAPEANRRRSAPRYNAMLDWRVPDRPAFCLAESLSEASAGALRDQLAGFGLPVVWEG